MNAAPKTPKNALGTFVRATRTRLGMSQAELADCVGVTSPDISRIETGRTKLPREARLKAVARCLNVNAGELLELSGWVGAEVSEADLNEALGRMVAGLDDKRREILNLLPVISDAGIEMVLSHARWVASDERKKGIAQPVETIEEQSVG